MEIQWKSELNVQWTLGSFRAYRDYGVGEA